MRISDWSSDVCSSDLKRGIPRDDYAIYVQQFRADATRVPEGKANMHIYAFVPLDLKDGGREKWDEVGEYWAERLIGGLRKIAPNVTAENIIARHFMTPLDITERKNVVSGKSVSARGDIGGG